MEGDFSFPAENPIENLMKENIEEYTFEVITSLSYGKIQ